MYPRNSASPPRIAVGAVVQISDGAVQSSGVSVVVRVNGGAETAGGGTIAYGASSSIVYYTPTQAETDYTDFCVVAYKALCLPVSVTVITTASSVPGRTMPADGSVTAAVIADNAIDTATFATGTTIPRCTLVDTTTTNTDMRGTNSAALAATALSTAQWTNTLATNLGTTNTAVAANLDATVSSRLAAASYISPPSAATISTQVASDLAAAHGSGSWVTADVSLLALQSTLNAVGVIVSGEAVKTTNIQSRLPAALSGGRMPAELDSAARVKLDATQPDYAPSTAASVAAEAVKTTAIQTSLTTVLARLGAWTGTGINTILGAIRSLAAKAAVLTPTDLSTGTTFDNTTDSLEAIKDGAATESELMVSTTIATVTSQTVLVLTSGSADNDVYNNQLVVITDTVTSTQKARCLVAGYVGVTKTLTLTAAPGFTVAAGDGIAIIAVASGSPSVTLTLGATIPLTLGVVTGLTEPLVIGDDYTTDVGRRIPITLTDTAGAAIAVTYGSHALATNCTIKAMFHPEGQNTILAALTGTCEFVAAVGATPAYLWLTLPRTETVKATPGKYQMQVEARWTDGFNVTLAHRGIATFARDIQRRA